MSVFIYIYLSKYFISLLFNKFVCLVLWNVSTTISSVDWRFVYLSIVNIRSLFFLSFVLYENCIVTILDESMMINWWRQHWRRERQCIEWCCIILGSISRLIRHRLHRHHRHRHQQHQHHLRRRCCEIGVWLIWLILLCRVGHHSRSHFSYFFFLYKKNTNANNVANVFFVRRRLRLQFC